MGIYDEQGGPAYPQAIEEDDEVGMKKLTTYYFGPSLRDQFATAAMSACISQCASDTRLPGESQAELIARRSYELADAMLRAREK